jgi:hypothetical protein
MFFNIFRHHKIIIVDPDFYSNEQMNEDIQYWEDYFQKYNYYNFHIKNF